MYFSFHTRENRGFDIVKSTMKYVTFLLYSTTSDEISSRLFWYAVLESLGVVGIAAYVFSSLVFLPQAKFYITNSLQVYVLQTFFTKTGRRYKV